MKLKQMCMIEHLLVFSWDICKQRHMKGIFDAHSGSRLRHFPFGIDRQWLVGNSSVGNESLLHRHRAGDRGSALMLSGGAGWSLWEPFCVWMTPTATLRRAPVVQLNPDLADKAGRARACTHTRRLTHTGKPKTQASTQNAHQGTAPARPQHPPPSPPLGLSQLLVTGVTQLQKDEEGAERKGGWEGRRKHVDEI